MLVQLSLMFVSKARDYLRIKHLNGASLKQAPALLANISPGWKSLPRTNTLVYYVMAKNIHNIGPGLILASKAFYSRSRKLFSGRLWPYSQIQV
jgi:hypothetical protein